MVKEDLKRRKAFTDLGFDKRVKLSTTMFTSCWSFWIF